MVLARRSTDAAALSDAEGRVASLAAEGRRNAEIAQDLGIGIKTVEAHLARAYRKLGVRSRTELAARRASELPRPGPKGGQR
jgi:DNA-binding CsgD family transcriptional regulator